MKSIIAKLLGLPKAILEFYTPIFREIVIVGAAELLPLALDIVRSLADSNRTGAQKREIAVRRLTKAATETGVSATESIIRYTVESAVLRMKQEVVR